LFYNNLASRDNTPSRGVIPQSSSTTVDEYYYNKLGEIEPVNRFYLNLRESEGFYGVAYGPSLVKTPEHRQQPAK